MGKRRDMTQRETLARVDDVSRRNRVASAREIIYEKNYAVDSDPVENLLKVDSLVPTAVRDRIAPFSSVVISHDDLPFQNAFSSKLAQFGFCLYPMLVVDLMHEFELGVWKAVFIHLLRILDCQNEGLKHELDRRYAFLKFKGPQYSPSFLDFEKYLHLGMMEYEKQHQTDRRRK
jgi:hypothetical protein